jgi:hypothetical protein
MGFNKRYINKSNLQQIKKQGLQYLISYITKPDALIIEDEFSEKVCSIVSSGRDIRINLEKIGFLINE